MCNHLRFFALCGPEAVRSTAIEEICAAALSQAGSEKQNPFKKGNRFFLDYPWTRIRDMVDEPDSDDSEDEEPPECIKDSDCLEDDTGVCEDGTCYYDARPIE